MAEAGRRAAEAARSMENELTRPLGVGVVVQPVTPPESDGVRSRVDSRTCSEPNSAKLDWFVLEPLAGNEKDDDPETPAIFLQQFGLHDDATVRPSTSGAPQPAAQTSTRQTLSL